MRDPWRVTFALVALSFTGAGVAAAQAPEAGAKTPEDVDRWVRVMDEVGIRARRTRAEEALQNERPPRRAARGEERVPRRSAVTARTRR